MIFTPAQTKAVYGLVGSHKDHIAIERAFGGGITVCRAEKFWVIDVNGRTTRIEVAA